MRDIFISWGSPDSATVNVLSDRLRDLGLSTWEYTYDMGAGDPIQEEVVNSIGDSRMAIICLSDQSAQRPWMKSEAAWITQAYIKGPMKHIIPVQVGEFDRKNLPHELKNLNLNVFNLTRDDKTAENMVRLIEDIYEKLGFNAPLIMPAALFAMTDVGSKQLLDTWRKKYERQPQEEGAPPPPALEQSLLRLWELCKAVGMQDPPELFTFLEGRYGRTPDELKPFQTDLKITDAINRVLREVNRARVSEKRRPIFLRWVSERWMSDDASQDFRDWWRSRDSLLVVDSISTYHPDIRSKVADVPAARAALLWLPPYTQHTASLEEALRFSAQNVRTLGDEFSNWERYPKRSVSFDTSTSLALKVWLRRALFDVVDNAAALEDNLDSLNGEGYATSGLGLGELLFGK